MAKDNKLVNNETEQRISRLKRRNELQKLSRLVESQEQRTRRLTAQKERQKKARSNESLEQRTCRLTAEKQRQKQAHSIESLEQRTSRLIAKKEHQKHVRLLESAEQQKCYRQLDAFRHSQAPARQTPKQIQNRLAHNCEIDGQHFALENQYYQTINTFCERSCDICYKQCYPNQVVKYSLVAEKLYLPKELKNKLVLEVCHRCNDHLKNNQKINPPSKAYWNNLDPGEIPEIIKNLTQPERQLLSRIIPFIKVIKYDGHFGQYGFKGQAILFALDIFEVSENLLSMLPRSSDEAGIVIITETLENLNVSHEYQISRARVYTALYWLIANNPLYNDVTINDFARLQTEDVIRVTLPPQLSSVQQEQVQQNLIVTVCSGYISIGNLSRILHASWNQGNKTIFASGYAGVQCFAMALANLVRAAILHPNQWDTNILNSNMISGDEIYANIRELTAMSNGGAHQIPESGYLELKNLDIIRNEFSIFANQFSLDYDDNYLCQGNLINSKNDGEVFKTLLDAFTDLFLEHNSGIIISRLKCLGLMHYDNKYYFTDSHSCGPKGAPLQNDNGKGCIIECDSIEELLRICRRVLPGNKNEQFSIHYIDVNVIGGINVNDNLQQRPSLQGTQQPHLTFVSQHNSSILTQHVLVHTCVMAPIDVAQPDVEEEIEENKNINKIVRKTANNIVNTNYERKAEEYAWFHLFPYGKNGLNENRQVKISALDYFQFRLLGKDTRFQKNDYLFYALSMFECDRVKSSISSCCKKIAGQDGAVEDIHLYMQNLRGSAAYWRTALNELIGQIRCLGPPTWFITLSCNDLNWWDMRKALLIADNRKDIEPNDITIDEAQHLIELYPIIVSRHFMRRFQALLKYFKTNTLTLGGKLKDYWWRIEFQNRGSPHVHMLIWIENAPSFEIDDGIQFIDDIVSCHLPLQTENKELHNFIKKNQMHHHTHTCYKNKSTFCRFGFPRPVSSDTRIVSQTSDEFIRNCGRICILKRRSEEIYINNYNSKVLEMWNGNMDIQPCGTNEAIAHYIAKYISKCEPIKVNESVAQAIKQIRQEDTNISRKLFKACMRILQERQVSACECAFRLCHLPLRGSTRNCVFLNTRKPEQRYYVIRFEGNRATGVHSNIFERYEKRPRGIVDGYNFDEMLLVEFAMLFETDYNKNIIQNEESVDAEIEDKLQNNKRHITLIDRTKMKIRNNPAVLRVPFFIMNNDPENYFYSLLLQYVPYYSESELLQGFQNARDAFIAREIQLRERNGYMETMRERDRQLEIAFKQAEAFQILEHTEEFNEEQLENVSQQCAMTDEQFKAAKNAMNVKQCELFNIVTASIENQLKGQSVRLKLFVTGGAGVGKTYIFKTLMEQISRCFGYVAVKVAALTGVAARLVGGYTLHALLKLPVQKDGILTTNMLPLTGNYLKIMRQQWKNIECMFIDEISMVPYEMLCMIDSRLRQLKNKDNEAFGGINIILFGDLMQLPPVRGSQVFHQPPRFLPATHLWRLFSLVELTENMRQQGDTTFVDLLNALRVGALKSHHFKELMSKLLMDEDVNGNFADEKAIRIYPTRAQVDAHNLAVLQKYRSNGIQIFKIKAQDQILDATRNMEKTSLENITPNDINKTGGLPKWLEIFKGAKVMLRSNVSVEKGLVNGAIGVVKDIKWPCFRRGQVYEEDVPAAEIDFGKDGNHIIQPKAIQFPAKYNYGTIERRQLPLILCWASTAHKMQGSTVDYAVVYLGKKLFQAGQAYVALSRVRSLKGLRIVELECSVLSGKKPCNENAIEEMERMRNYQPSQQS